jgi:NADH:ubiquinone oxidoreductase subunit 4 (subunit M)
MHDLGLLLMAIFLPVFPLSILFNALFMKIRQPLLRLALLLGWPAVGVALYQAWQPPLPEWMVALALGTAVLYAFRLLAMREVGIWTGYMATSVWACLWLPLVYGDNDVLLYVFWFGVPLGLLALLVASLEKRFGAAYTDLYAGLAQTIPRFSGVFAVTVLAVVATPLFPGFFGMLHILVASQPAVALTLAGVWFLWSWAGMRLIQGMIVGERSNEAVSDISQPLTWGFAALMLLLVVAGFGLTGEL